MGSNPQLGESYPHLKPYFLFNIILPSTPNFVRFSHYELPNHVAVTKQEARHTNIILKMCDFSSSWWWPLTNSMEHSPSEKLTGFQLVKKFPALYGTRRFITAFTRARSNQSIPPHSTSLRSILILSYHLRLGLPSGSSPQANPPKPCMHLTCLPYM